MKLEPGYKTTEFWLSLSMCILSFLMVSGVIGPHTTAHKIAALVVSSLGALGYTCSRTILKSKSKKG
jgi:hypothetical protein